MLVFVTCQNYDVPHILNFSGEQSLVIGTDYGHIDSTSEVDAITEFNGLERLEILSSSDTGGNI